MCTQELVPGSVWSPSTTVGLFFLGASENRINDQQRGHKKIVSTSHQDFTANVCVTLCACVLPLHLGNWQQCHPSYVLPKEETKPKRVHTCHLTLWDICQDKSYAWRRTHCQHYRHHNLRATPRNFTSRVQTKPSPWLWRPSPDPLLQCVPVYQMLLPLRGVSEGLSGNSTRPPACRRHFVCLNQHAATCKADSVCERRSGESAPGECLCACETQDTVQRYSKRC